MRRLALFVALLLNTALFAQTNPAFEVASIRPSASEPSGPTGMRIAASQAVFSFMSLKAYIGIAYGVRDDQIAGPDWLASARFDITAKMPDEPKVVSRLPVMMRSLLEDRFKIRAHHERREFPIYALEVAPNGPPLVRVPEEEEKPGLFDFTTGDSGGRRVTMLGGGATLALGDDNRFEAKRVTMTMLAEMLSARFVDWPVVDMTNLEGRYNVVFSLSPEDFQAMMTRSVVAGGFAPSPEQLHRLESASPVAIPDALERLGLLLKPRRAPIEVLVIDHIERPKEN